MRREAVVSDVPWPLWVTRVDETRDRLGKSYCLLYRGFIEEEVVVVDGGESMSLIPERRDESSLGGC